MSLELCVLASGSAGNCAVVRTPAGVMLIDAGIGPRVAARRLYGSGASLGDVKAICLTHLDRDHFNPAWMNAILRGDVGLFCHASRIQQLQNLCDGRLDARIEGFDRAFEPLAGVRVEPIALAHDRDGSHGFVIDSRARRLGYATDLGRAPGELIERFAGTDVLAIESNYDPRMQEQSPRPWFLKQRIMGGRGHLSNEQAFAAVRQILDRCEALGRRLPAHVVLLHRSRQCNCPRIVRQVFSQDARIAGRLMLAEQFERSRWIGAVESPACAGEQMMLTWDLSEVGRIRLASEPAKRGVGSLQ